MTKRQNRKRTNFWECLVQGDADACWPWARSHVGGTGYGQFKIGGSTLRAHRLAYMLTYGPLQPNIVVMHTCDNPACCNPGHLRLGTLLENTRDMIDKGRKVVRWNPDNKPPKFSGESHPRATITKEIALAIKESNGNRAELIKKYGVTANIIKSIRSGRTWSNL